MHSLTETVLKIAVAALGALAIGVAAAVFAAFLCAALWNEVVSEIFHLGPVSYFQTCCLLLLANIVKAVVFGGNVSISKE